MQNAKPLIPRWIHSGIFQQPAQPSSWFQSHFTGAHTESGITRWYGALKGISEKQCKQYLDMVSEDFPHHHSFAARRTAKGRSGMGPSFQVDREVQRPSIGQNHCHHYADDGVTTVTLLPTFHHKTQPLTNSQTIQAQHHNLEHRQTTSTDTGTTQSNVPSICTRLYSGSKEYHSSSEYNTITINIKNTISPTYNGFFSSHTSLPTTTP